jgi:hypothetical protein
LVCASDVNILGGGIHTIRKSTDALVVASKENGLEVHADKTKYMVKSRDQNAGLSYNTKNDNSSFEYVCGTFQLFGKKMTDHNCSQ